MKPNYTVIIHTPQELNHSSYVQTGLFELEKLGLINVKVRLVISKNSGRITVAEDGTVTRPKKSHPKTSFYRLIDHTTQKEISFATDLYDHANEFSEVALSTCDFLFKRSYESKYVQAFPSQFQDKIHRLGMTFGTHSDNKRAESTFRWGLFLSNLYGAVKWDRRLFSRLIKSYNAQSRHWKFINTTRSISRFEAYALPTGNTILFQTRCFLHENDDDVREIHKQRYRLIKLLRAQFPDNFMGGFVSSKMANEKYKDALTDVPSSPDLYLEVMKKAKIVIYTRGLANSPAWKMAEYLSQGKVIIAEPLTTELPVPLTEGKEVLFFRNETELIDAIKRVLTDKDLAECLSKNARAYFEQHVHPVQNTKRILELMLNKSLS